MKLDNPWVLAPPWRLGRCGAVMKPDCLALDLTIETIVARPVAGSKPDILT
jgi:hypothetical protein